ncbi:MAG: Ig-like domain-containing protein, partial [Acidobacteriota bacterium]
TPPYSTTWANFGAGTYDLFAKATGTLGTIGSSQVVRVTVSGDSAPIVVLTSPTEGAQYTSPATITLAATASDPDGTIAKVEFLAGATLVGMRTAPPYGATWSNVGAGSYALRAKATDNLGVSAISSPINVTVVAGSSPSISLTAPQNGAQFAQGQAIVLTANATTPAKTIDRVEFYADATLLRAVTVPGSVAAATVNFTWSGAVVGAHALSARVFATDGANATSPTVNVTVSDLAVVLTEPYAGQVYQAPGDIRISANPTETAGTIARVDFYGDGVLRGSATVAPYSFLWSGVAAGAHTVSATARDSGGLTASAGPVAISVVSAPTLNIDASIDGSTVADDNVSISGIVQAPVNSAVSVNGRLAMLDRDGHFYVDNVPLLPGSNTLTVTGNTQDGSQVTRTISLNRSGIAPFAVNVVPQLGLAPLDVQLIVTNRGNVPFQRIEVDANGDGATELTLTSLTDNEARVSLNYLNPGLYRLRVTIFDAANQVIYTATRSVIARDPRDVAGLVTQVFTGMLDRLHAGNISGALSAITNTVRNKYQSVFSRLGTRLPSILDNGFGVVTGLAVTNEFADITVVRNKQDGQYGYHVLLIRDDDGLWRIDDM